MIPIFNSYAPSGTPRWYSNQTHTLGGQNEATLFDSLTSEYYCLYGSDVTWLPREVGKEESVFGEYLAAVFDRGFPLRMFIEETEAWGGSGDIYSKFGLQVTDECTLYINKTSFFNASASGYPKQGDLAYIPKSQKLFEVSHIEDETAPGFYLFGNRTGYKITCKLFSYNHQEINQAPDVGIPAAIQALDALLEDTDTTEQVTIQEKEIRNNNIPIQTQASFVIDTTEEDALG